VIACATLAVFAWSTLPWVDDLKLAAFARACGDASERVFKATRADKLEFDYWPYSGVMEDEYYPLHLAESLLEGESRIASVHLAYEMPRDKVVNASCAGRHVLVASRRDQLRIPACGKQTLYEAVAHPRYAVRYQYGKTNFLSIRTFRISIEDSTTGSTLAEQRSYQLLLGSMNRRENARWYGWGSAQGARVCRLTPPKQFIMQVVDAK
jgi:hypothetical protein